MDALGVVLAIIIGLFFLLVVSYAVCIVVVLFKGFIGLKRKQAEFERRFSKNYERRPPRNYK
jgi:hypothetical protein